MHAPSQTARKWLFAAGVLYLTLAAVQQITTDYLAIAYPRALWIGAIALGAAHVGLWAGARAHPRLATTAGLVLFVAVQLAAAAYDPVTVLAAAAFKLVIAVVLVRAVIASFGSPVLR